MKLKVKKLHPDAILPKYQTAGANCFDLHTCDHLPTIVDPNAIFRTWLAFEVQKDHVMLVFSRSGHGFKSDTRLSNCVGVVDSDYRGEVMVKLARDEAFCDAVQVSPGDRVAQAMIVYAPQVEIEWAELLDDTERGTKGLGSTGQ